MLNRIGIIIGILVSVIALANSGIEIYEKTINMPRENIEINTRLAGLTPIFSKSIIVKPSESIDMSINVSFRVFDTGDVIIESGSTRKLIPFDLGQEDIASNFLINSAYAETLGAPSFSDKSKPSVSLKYIESSEIKADGNLHETRTYEDGSIEEKTIDLGTNKILHRETRKESLSNEQLEAINKSTYTQEIYNLK